jgi:putative restriction endonuclease
MRPKKNKLYVGITDTEWMNFIRRKNNTNELGKEINFWTPGSTQFKALEPGELFLFKMHDRQGNPDENGEIVGGGYFLDFQQMTISEAWKRFGYGNGCASETELSIKIRNYQEKKGIEISDTIGCIILGNIFILPREKWIKTPSDFSKAVVRGKSYETSEGTGKELMEMRDGQKS